MWWFQFAFALLIGALLFLATNNSIASGVLPAVVAVRQSLQSGLWVWSHDPNKLRGRVCAAFYLATAGWKCAATALACVLIFFGVAEFTGRNPDLDRFGATMVALLIGICVTTVFGLVATFVAARHRMRIWVHPEHSSEQIRALRHREQAGELSLSDVETVESGAQRFNHAIFVVATSLIFPATLIGLAVLVAAIAVDPESKWASILAGCGMVAVFACPLSMIPLYGWLSRRIIATTPSECSY